MQVAVAQATATCMTLEMRKAIMKTLESVAVFGLVPVLPMPDASRDACHDPRAMHGEWPLPLFDHLLTERMATQEELARVRDELKQSCAKPARQ